MKTNKRKKDIIQLSKYVHQLSEDAQKKLKGGGGVSDDRTERPFP